MPNRIIRESALTSESLNRLSAEAERMFWRLTIVADDYGRFEADPRILLAKCFPLRVGELTAAEVERLRDEITATGTIELYEARGRLYGHFPRWFEHQRRRESKPKHPGPDDPAATCRDLPQSAATCGGSPQPAADSGDSRQPAATGGESPQPAARARALRGYGAEGMEPRVVRREGGGKTPQDRLAKIKALDPRNGNGAQTDPLKSPLAIAILRGWRLLVEEFGLRSAELDPERDPRFCESFVARMRDHPKGDDWSYMFEQIPKMPTCLGAGSPPPGNTDPWKISLQWIVASEENWNRAYRRRWGD